MSADFEAICSALKVVLRKYAKRLSVKTDTPAEYTLVAKSPSPFPQHKGEPLYFASVKPGKAYVSFHLMPLYMCPPLANSISADLKKRMQGKTCFNFKTEPDQKQLAELQRLTEAGLQFWTEKGWL
jgi:hypothetical protein